MAIEEYDNMNYWRCPPLGGPVPFKHCRTTNNGLPCLKMPDCWQGKFNAIQFLKDNYSEEELKTAFSPQPGRLERLLELLDKYSREKSEE
ncbi:MAG: hypothetical protein WCX65_07180 [bacterium]